MVLFVFGAAVCLAKWLPKEHGSWDILRKSWKKSTTAETFKENHNNGAPRALEPKTTAETFKEKQTKDYVNESNDDGGGDDENHKKHMEI